MGRSGGLEVLGHLGKLVAKGVEYSIILSQTRSASGWSKMECSRVRTYCQDDIGVLQARIRLSARDL
jgi:hypothetical protein